MTGRHGYDPTATPSGATRDSSGRHLLSPAEIRHATLGRTGLGRRGYHEPDVDQLLDRIACDVEAWSADTTSLRAENETLRATIRDCQREHVDRSAVLPPPSPAESAMTLLAQAQEHVREMSQRVANRYDGLLRGAQNQADEEAALAVHDYRFRSGGRYTAAFEDLERRLTWVRVFLAGVEGIDVAQPEVDGASPAWDAELDGLGWGPERFM